MTRMAPKPGAAYRTQPATPSTTGEAREAQRAALHRASGVSVGSQSTQLTLRWRIGRNGGLALALDSTGSAVRVALTMTPDTDRRGLARDVMSRANSAGSDLRQTVPPAQTLHYVGEGDVVHAAGEWTIAMRFSRRPDIGLHHDELGDSPALAEFAACLSVIESAIGSMIESSTEIESGKRPLVLTDLPSRIGLAGGTYALDEAKAHAFCDALRSLELPR